MRTMADLQRAPGTAPAPKLPLHVDNVRTFDTPEFAGMQFLEVHTKTALNRVKGMGFAWSINPYRGCSHACSYCLAGETLVLMADGRTRPLADVGKGDVIYGTVASGVGRALVVTEVLDHWSTVRSAWRVALHDGTEVMASGDHRFLTGRGWVPVTELTDHDTLTAPDALTPDESWKIGRTESTKLPKHVRTVEPLGVEMPMYDITTGTGDFIADGVVSHNCFARPTHQYLNMSPLGDFERKVVVKTNLVEVLERELRRASWQREHVAMGTNTDNYQRCEGRYELMPGVIKALGASGTPFSILTKGTLITRDLGLLAEASAEVDVGAAFTIGMLDEELWRSVEPGTPSPKARLAAVRALNDAGVPTGVMLAPIMPGLNDDPEQLDDLVDAIAAAGATHISPIVLHLRPGVKEVFMPWLEATHPHLVQRYRGLYRGSNAPKSYREQVAELVAQARRRAWRRHGRPARRRPRAAGPPPPSGTRTDSEQLTLW